METKICKCCGRELPIENFKLGRNGQRVGVCTPCAVEKLRANKAAKRLQEAQEKERETQDARNMKLKDFTPRELMEELARRGYEGKLRFVRIEEIDIKNF